MKPRALVVEDDVRIIEEIEDTLFSIEHDHRWVTNQHDARQALQADTFDYVLLDLQIPARADRGGADMQFGIHLLEEIGRTCRPDSLPVVVMTGHVANGFNLSTRLSELGATDFIAKPFLREGRTLASVIRDVLITKRPRREGQRSTGAGQAFAGGDLEFFPDRIELCGVRIISDIGTGQSMSVLNELRAKDRHGRHVRRSAEQLARAIGAPATGTITSCIRHLRKNIERRLFKHQGLVCSLDQVIDHDQQGYFLREWIAVHDRVADVPAGTLCGSEVSNVPALAAQNVPAGTLAVDLPVAGTSEDVPAGTPWNERQSWALHELSKEGKLTRQQIERTFHIGDKTAKRDMQALREAGLVEFVRQGRDGHYRLRKVVLPR
jgi:DNA-binding response OmpR family regulator